MSRCLKFWILEEVGLHYLRGENKGTDQPLRLCFGICRNAGFLMTRLIWCQWIPKSLITEWLRWLIFYAPQTAQVIRRQGLDLSLDCRSTEVSLFTTSYPLSSGKRDCLVCVTELLAPFLKFPEVSEANGGNKKFEFQKFWGRGGATINDTHTSSGLLL